MIEHTDLDFELRNDEVIKEQEQFHEGGEEEKDKREEGIVG